MTLSDREKFVMLAICMHATRPEKEDEDKFIKDMYSTAEFFIPSMKKAEFERIYIDEIMPEFEKFIENAKAFTVNRNKKEWSSP